VLCIVKEKRMDYLDRNPGTATAADTTSVSKMTLTFSPGRNWTTSVAIALMVLFAFSNPNVPPPQMLVTLLVEEVRDESQVRTRNVMDVKDTGNNSTISLQRHNPSQPVVAATPSNTSNNEIVTFKDGQEEDKKELVLTHYLGHIPKSGTSYAFGALSKLLYRMPEYHEYIRVHGQYRTCNEGAVMVRKWRNKFTYEYRDSRCTLWMTEPGSYSSDAQHGYVILREPIGHTVSMYFHCTESRDHHRMAYRMPSTIDEWIQAWHDAQNNQTKARENKYFQCYDPLDFQARTIAFDPALGKEDIRKKWDIIGDNAQMDKTVCLILIKYSGWVPKECDCTNQRRRLGNDLAYDPNTHAHGVQHHGASFQTTPKQQQMISDIRRIDLQLYDLVVKEIFPEQVREVEQEHNITICDKFRDISTEA
jgi:hypothetical protein